jgi:hypothetical protein
MVDVAADECIRRNREEGRRKDTQGAVTISLNETIIS